MCGRLVVVEPDLSVFVEPFGVQVNDVLGWLPRFNLAPTQLAPLIVNEPERRLTLARFGLVPAWAKDQRIANKLINARVESVGSSKVFGRALTRHRGIIPVTGYFEWQALGGRRRQPLFIHDARGAPLALAGLWERWHAPEGQVVTSFAVITRPALGALAAIHSRMPLALPKAAIARWLAPETQTAQQLANVLSTEPDVEHWITRPVSQQANSPRNDGPECLAEASAEPVSAKSSRQLQLFDNAEVEALQARRTR